MDINEFGKVFELNVTSYNDLINQISKYTEEYKSALRMVIVVTPDMELKTRLDNVYNYINDVLDAPRPKEPTPPAPSNAARQYESPSSGGYKGPLVSR